MPTATTSPTLAELQARAKKTFKRYDEALRRGDDGEAAEALERYQELTEQERTMRRQLPSRETGVSK